MTLTLKTCIWLDYLVGWGFLVHGSRRGRGQDTSKAIRRPTPTQSAPSSEQKQEGVKLQEALFVSLLNV